MESEQIRSKVNAIVLGHAVGDALGGPIQRQERAIRDRAPVTDITPFCNGRFDKGVWSDDTSMALCAMDALAKHGLDLKEVMQNFDKWLFKNEFTPTGVTFDVGKACYDSIKEFNRTKSAEGHGRLHETENGNGSIMRIYPFSLYMYFSDFPLDGKIAYIHRASALTHAHPRCRIGCGIYSFILWQLVENPSKQGIKVGLNKAQQYYRNEPELQHYRRLFNDDFSLLPRNDIKSSGYVVDTLEAAVWCAVTTDNYRDCVLKAVNLGGDTDSIGAVAGSIAGLLYGCDNIPLEWKNALIKKEFIDKTIRQFGDALCSPLAQKEYKRHKSYVLETIIDTNSARRTRNDYSAHDINITDNTWQYDFWTLCEDLPQAQNPIFCNGISPESWYAAENCPIYNTDEKAVIFEYAQNLGLTSLMGIAFTTYRNYQKFLRCVDEKDNAQQTLVPLWDYTAIYKIPDFNAHKKQMCCDAVLSMYTFDEVRDYLAQNLPLNPQNIMAWSPKKQDYIIGSFDKIAGPHNFKKVLRKNK